MKNTIKVLGTIALAIVIGFSFSACGGGDGGTPTETETPLEFNGKTASNDDITIVISRTAPRAAITPKNGDYYKITKSGDVKSQGTIMASGKEFIFKSSTGDTFQGRLDEYSLSLAVRNIPASIGIGENFTAVSKEAGEGKSVTITGLPKYITDYGFSTNLIGVWLVKELTTPFVNTAIQALWYDNDTDNNKAVFNLVVPKDNTWSGDPKTGKSQPRWNGSGDYYVLICPIVNFSYSDWAFVYIGDTPNTPQKVTFNASNPNVTLDFSKFE